MGRESWILSRRRDPVVLDRRVALGVQASGCASRDLVDSTFLDRVSHPIAIFRCLTVASRPRRSSALRPPPRGRRPFIACAIWALLTEFVTSGSIPSSRFVVWGCGFVRLTCGGLGPSIRRSLPSSLTSACPSSTILCGGPGSLICAYQHRCRRVVRSSGRLLLGEPSFCAIVPRSCRSTNSCRASAPPLIRRCSNRVPRRATFFEWVASKANLSDPFSRMHLGDRVPKFDAWGRPIRLVPFVQPLEVVGPLRPFKRSSSQVGSSADPEPRKCIATRSGRLPKSARFR